METHSTDVMVADTLQANLSLVGDEGIRGLRDETKLNQHECYLACKARRTLLM